MLTKEQSRATREMHGLSQRRAAAEAEVPRSYLNQFENGRWIPTDDFLLKLTGYYNNLAVDDQLYATYQPPSPLLTAPMDGVHIVSDTVPDHDTATPREAASIDAESSTDSVLLTAGVIVGLLALTGALPVAGVLLSKIVLGVRGR